MDDENSFIGTGWAFPPSFDPHSRSVEVVKNERDIIESLRILLSTTPGERTMEPEYGCDLSPLAFQRLDLNLETLMVNNIKKAILYYEPRILVDSVKIDTEDRLEGTIHIKVNYTIRATNTVQNMVYPYYFEEPTLSS
ncbi:MAG: GPW/gp25 family protein [Bacteroidota bacterium]